MKKIIKELQRWCFEKGPSCQLLIEFQPPHRWLVIIYKTEQQYIDRGFDGGKLFRQMNRFYAYQTGPDLMDVLKQARKEIK